MNSEDLQHPELILNQYRVNLLNKLKLTANMIICREMLWVIYIVFQIISLQLSFESFTDIFICILYGLIILAISYTNIPRLINCKRALSNISILKERPLYLSKIAETIFLLYRHTHKERKQIKNLQIKQENSLFISYFKEKIKQEKQFIVIMIMIFLSNLIIFDFNNFIIIDLLPIAFLGLLILAHFNINKYSKSWMESYSNLSHWNEFFSNYEIIPKNKELSLLERDFQQFENEISNQKLKCPVCNMYNDSNSNYCDSCGNELKHRRNKN